MNRFDRITAIFVQLQAKRVVRGAALAAQFEVSLRTIYRDLRTLEEAGVPLCGEAGVGYSLAEGYRLPPVMFTREEATALLTAEKMAARLTDAHTARLGEAAMDKLRAVLRRPDRDYLENLSPHIQIFRPTTALNSLPGGHDLHQQLLAAIATQRVVHLHYQAGYNGVSTQRDTEPIGLSWASNGTLLPTAVCGKNSGIFASTEFWNCRYGKKHFRPDLKPCNSTGKPWPPGGRRKPLLCDSPLRRRGRYKT